MTFKIPNFKKMDYCPSCRSRTEHVKDISSKLCKKCGKSSKPTLKF